MEDIIIEFEKNTKYPLLDFLSKISDFLTNSYPEIDSYFSGTNQTINSKHILLLKEIIEEFEKFFSLFQSFANKFANVGYWDLLDYLSEIHTTIEKISKLPKYKRTVLFLGNYIPKVQAEGTVGGLRTFEDVVQSLNYSDLDSWVQLMIYNDLNETDWSIDKLKKINVFLPNQTTAVETILDQPIGKKVYGIDVYNIISFEYQDLALVVYEDNVIQKCGILLEVIQNDIPEYPWFGRSSEIMNVAQFSYPKIASEISDLFLQNDLFKEVSLSDSKYNDGSVEMKFDIKTKYDYKTEKQITI